MKHAQDGSLNGGAQSLCALTSILNLTSSSSSILLCSSSARLSGLSTRFCALLSSLWTLQEGDTGETSSN